MVCQEVIFELESNSLTKKKRNYYMVIDRKRERIYNIICATEYGGTVALHQRVKALYT